MSKAHDGQLGETSILQISSPENHVAEKYKGTRADRHDMAVLGRRQQLRRNFKMSTMLGFASMVMVAWEASLVLIPYGPLSEQCAWHILGI